jgi:1,4-dihydroxy-2-naphthoyl-CoA synthase
MAFETVLYEKIDKVAKITLNRPEVRNAESQQRLLLGSRYG